METPMVRPMEEAQVMVMLDLRLLEGTVWEELQQMVADLDKALEWVLLEPSAVVMETDLVALIVLMGMVAGDVACLFMVQRDIVVAAVTAMVDPF